MSIWTPVSWYLVTIEGLFPTPVASKVGILVPVGVQETVNQRAVTIGVYVVAGLRRLVSQGKIKSEDLTVAFITGNGLKVQELVDDLVNPINIKPTYDSFQREMTNYSSNNGS